MEADFRGWATKAGLKCSDGRTIMPGAFKDQDKVRVPLVWQHGHTDPQNVLGHAILENRDEGVYAYGFFNKTEKAKHAAELLTHEDINSMSIWANELVQRAGRVLHGVIREVSLVLSGANPGALIENVTIRHSDGDEEVVDDEAIIFSGEELEHGDGTKPDDKKKELEHAEGDDPTLQEILDSMSDQQKKALEYIVGEAVDAATAEHSNIDDKTGEDDKVSRNVFEKDGKTQKDDSQVLSHDALRTLNSDAMDRGMSFRKIVQEYALAHGIENIDVLFPEATQLTSAPEFFARRADWVNGVLNGARKSPFSRVRTATADLTWEDARAKGYIKGNMKKEEFYSVARRETTPQTIYKKQKLDRDDIIDITDFDVVAWMKGEMRIMLDEELARAVLVGDGRDPGDEDKIREDRIRPIVTDDDFYAIKLAVSLADDNTNWEDVLDEILLARQFYRGSGNPTFYTTETTLARLLLIRDGQGRKIYPTVGELTTAMRVSGVVTVEVLNDYTDLIGVLVNMADYNIGADRGGAVAMFDDFDIDYNQYKYLIETRCSGALVRPKSAIVVSRAGATDVFATAPAPTFVQATGVYTIPVTAQADYVDQDGNPVADGDHTLAPGDRITITAVPTAGNFFGSSETQTWKFYRPTA
jgi:hypothetical protein